MRKKTLSACIMAALLTTGITSTQVSAGILAEGNISVYRGGHLTSTITGKTPVTEEALMVCNDKCMIKSTGVSLVGATGTELAVKNDQEQFNLLVRKGKLDFILNGAVTKMGFYLPDGQYTVADVVFNANTNSPVRGYITVDDSGEAKIGVDEGRMVFNTAEGAKIVDSNNYILLAQSGMGVGAGAASSGYGVGAGAAAGVGAGAGAGTAAVASGGSMLAGLGAASTGALVAGSVVAATAVGGAVTYATEDPAPRLNTIPPANPSGNR
ncbi:MAG: hypothetical protein D3920_13060 [Candidatus Electrothrix sp. AW2]|nr:hypothetical protein [Candidatus Electrothrix gigas]